MMKSQRTLLKRDESYAIHALLNIAEKPGTNAAQIAADLSMPPAFMAKVLRKLVKAGFIESQMGRSGGVQLKIPIEKVSLLKVMEAISGPMILDTCQTQQRCATQKRTGHCNLKVVWLQASLHFREYFDDIKLADLQDKNGSVA